MGRVLAQRSPAAAAVLEEAERHLGAGFRNLLFDGPQAELGVAVRAQCAVATVDTMAYEALLEAGVAVEGAAGYSLGAFPALVAAGALDFRGALSIVVRTAELYEERFAGYPAGMASVVGLAAPRPAANCAAAAAKEEPVAIAATVHPSLLVVSGHAAALGRALGVAEREALKIHLLPVTWPIHSPLLRPISEQLGREIPQLARLDEPRLRVYSVLDGRLLRRRSEVWDLCRRLVSFPTHWAQVMVHFRREGFDHYYECGAGQQLSRIMRFWDRSARVETVAEGYPPLAARARAPGGGLW